MGGAEVFVRRVTRGRFITLEGGEAVGKSTQVRQLGDRLRNRGVDVVLTREPGGTPGAEAIRLLLMTGDKDRWSATAEALLFAAARADHVEKTVRPALNRGCWVISDRFVDSTRAYQGGAGGVSDEDVMTLHAIGSDGLMPDRTILLRLTHDEAIARARGRATPSDDRFETRDDAYHRHLATRFERFAADEPDRFRLVDASGDVNAVGNLIFAAIEDLL